MKIQSVNILERHGQTTLMTICIMIHLISFMPSLSHAASAKEIDISVEVSLNRFHGEVEGAGEFAKIAKGLLVFPGVMKAGFVIGGEYGEGALKIDGNTADYYNMTAGSWGFQIGAEKKDVIIAFMTDGAMEKFRNSSGWEAGVDGNIAIINFGGGKRIDTTTIKDPIIAFIFNVKGLMVDVSLKGSKISRLNKSGKE